MRWRNLPVSTNIEQRSDERPSGLAQAMIHVGTPRTSLDDAYYAALRGNYLHDNPPDPNSWANTHMPSDLPTTPLADPSMEGWGLDPSIMARAKMPPEAPVYTGPTAGPNNGFGMHAGSPLQQRPGMTLNSVPSFWGSGI